MDIERSKYLVGMGVKGFGAWAVIPRNLALAAKSVLRYACTLRPNNFYTEMFLSQWIACKQTSMWRTKLSVHNITRM